MSKVRISDLVRFGEWLPDRPENNNPGSNNVNNVLVEGESYKPFKSFNTSGGQASTAGRIFGAFSFIDDESNVVNIAGDQNDLFRLDGSTWQNISRSTTAANAYNTSATEQWRFASFDQRIIATNLADDMQSYIVGTSTAFTALSTDAPKARDIAVINNFLVAGHVDDGTLRPNRVQWSALDDPTSWSTSAVTLSDFQDLPDDGGAISRVVQTQNYGVIVRERQIVRMEFIGSPGVFQFTVAERNRGTKAVNSVISDGIIVYYLDENGFYAFNGTNSVPIGDNKVDRYFLSRLDEANLNLVKAALDPVEKYVAWGYKNASKDGNITDIIMYHWTENRWSQAEENLDIIESIFTTGQTLDGLDSVSTSIDLLGTSLDSRVWQGGKATIGGYSTDHRLGFFDGSNKKATLESAESMLNAGGLTRINTVMPIVDSTGVTARIKHRRIQTDSLTVTSSATFDTQTNEIPFRVSDKYHRVEMTIPESSTWELCQGFRFRSKTSGVK